ncbi:MAG: integrase catalytic domain-containing protein [Candidatus Binatia bacterium]
MSGKSRWDYLKAIYSRYKKVSKPLRARILDEFCQVCGYNRKYAIRLLNGPAPQKPEVTAAKGRRPTYGAKVILSLTAIWEAAGYPCSARLKALLPLWLPWAIKRLAISAQVQNQLLSISAATIDRRLKAKKRQLKKRLYGRTKPGTLLKHHIPIKTDSWDVSTAGFTETDLVSHSGNSEKGEFIHSLNVTDIHTTWVESRAVMGKGQAGVLEAMKEIEQALPFKLLGIDSDNGSEFINYHLKAFCDQKQIQFTRGRPYKKDDNAHIEQKNWTHVRKIFGYLRYDSDPVRQTMNDLYQNELRTLQNLFLPSMKLISKARVGSKLKRRYDKPQTPLERVAACPHADPLKLAKLQKLRDATDPFALAKTINQKLERIYQLANHRVSPSPQAPQRSPRPLTRAERQAVLEISELLGTTVHIRTPKTTHRRVTS